MPSGTAASPWIQRKSKQLQNSLARQYHGTSIVHGASGAIRWQFADSPEIKALATPLRLLLRSSETFDWNQDHDALLSPPLLMPFDPSLETVLQTDASRKKNGLGYGLLQQHPEGWKLVQCGSRFVYDTKSRWTMVKLEMKSVKWTMENVDSTFSNSLRLSWSSITNPSWRSWTNTHWTWSRIRSFIAWRRKPHHSFSKPSGRRTRNTPSRTLCLEHL